jgi:hypothetical protein
MDSFASQNETLYKLPKEIRATWILELYKSLSVPINYTMPKEPKPSRQSSKILQDKSEVQNEPKLHYSSYKLHVLYFACQKLTVDLWGIISTTNQFHRWKPIWLVGDAGSWVLISTNYYLKKRFSPIQLLYAISRSFQSFYFLKILLL